MILEEIISNGCNVSITATAADLREFALAVAGEVLEARLREKEEERWLTADDVRQMLGASASTLWRWQKSGYLVPFKVGRKCRYKLSDVRQLMDGAGDIPTVGEVMKRTPIVDAYKKRKGGACNE